ncbi:hypothetical protein GCM10009616_31650 [Microlunatus lacustris]
MTDLLEDAVLDNAAWCDAVCRAAGLPTSASAEVWSVGRRSPDGYPDAVTLRPGLRAATVLARIEAGDGCSVKDSFADLDLAPAGFGVLFEASWIGRRAPTTSAPLALDWLEVSTAAELTPWSRRLEVPPLPPALLTQPGLHVLGAVEVGAGFVLSRTGAVVGVSHAVPGAADPAILWADVVALAGQLHPGADLVGYEQGADLEHSSTAGFEPIGTLRVWMR